MDVKKIIKEKLKNRADSFYRETVAEKRISFDEWIRKKESGLERFDMTLDLIGADLNLLKNGGISYSAKIGATSVRIIPYSEVREGFKVSNFLEDILVFVNGSLTDKAIPLLIKRFSENQEMSICYGDEDLAEIDETETTKYGRSVYGTRRDPFFKPEWSPNAFLDHFYFCNVVAIRRNSFRETEWSKKGGASGVYETLLKFIFSDEHNLRKSVDRIDEILVHAKDYELNDLRLEEAPKYAKRLLSIPEDRNEIAVVIPSKDNPHLLKQCLSSMNSVKAPSTKLEVIVVDNGSSPENREKIEKLSDEYGFKYIYSPMEFNFPIMINTGVEASSKEIVLILNDDITFTEPNTLENLAKHVKYGFSGAVGAKLLYPDSSKIQHAGVINNRIGPVHKLQFLDDTKAHYHGFNKMVQNVSAVTGACIMVRREVFDLVKGMDPDLRVAFNDIDFCFSILESGYSNVVCNDISLVHAESVTRGNDSDTESLQRLNSEKDKLYNKHPKLAGYDPFYSKYLLNDCLDSRIVPASDYEYPEAKEKFSKLLKEDLTKAREEKCVQLSVEFADELKKFTFRENDSKDLYLQGFSYLAGSDNACYEKYILLKSESAAFKFKINGCLRYDIAIACPTEENVELSGFAVAVPKDFLIEGSYRVGILYKKKFSSERLYAFSNKFLAVK